jgi:hypothetical protein
MAPSARHNWTPNAWAERMSPDGAVLASGAHWQNISVAESLAMGPAESIAELRVYGTKAGQTMNNLLFDTGQRKVRTPMWMATQHLSN